MYWDGRLSTTMRNQQKLTKEIKSDLQSMRQCSCKDKNEANSIINSWNCQTEALDCDYNQGITSSFCDMIKRQARLFFVHNFFVYLWSRPFWWSRDFYLHWIKCIFSYDFFCISNNVNNLISLLGDRGRSPQRGCICDISRHHPVEKLIWKISCAKYHFRH